MYARVDLKTYRVFKGCKRNRTAMKWKPLERQMTFVFETTTFGPPFCSCQVSTPEGTYDIGCIVAIHKNLLSCVADQHLASLVTVPAID